MLWFFLGTFSYIVKQVYSPGSQNSLAFVSFSLVASVLCVMKVIAFRYLRMQAEERLRFGLINVPHLKNHYDHSKTTFILGVLSTKGHPEHLLSGEDSTKPMFLSQMVRKVTVASFNPTLIQQRFSQKVVASVKVEETFGSASTQ